MYIMFGLHDFTPCKKNSGTVDLSIHQFLVLHIAIKKYTCTQRVTLFNITNALRGHAHL